MTCLNSLRTSYHRQTIREICYIQYVLTKCKQERHFPKLGKQTKNKKITKMYLKESATSQKWDKRTKKGKKSYIKIIDK